MSIIYPMQLFPDIRPIFVHHIIGMVQRYTSAGVLYATSITVTTKVTGCEAKVPGGIAMRLLWLKSDKTWSTSSALYANPPILSSLSASGVRMIFADPTQVFGSVDVSPLLLLGRNTCENVNLPGWIIASHDESPAAILSYDESVTKRFWRTLYLREGSSPPADWTELGDTAADNINQVSVNSLAYVRDLKTMLGSLQATVSLAKNPANPKKWANWWLSMRYGDRLTYRDTLEISHAVAGQMSTLFKRWNKDYYISRACDSTIEYSESDRSFLEIQRHLKLYYKPKYDDWVSKIIRSALKWDLWPTLDNSWDLIPFSFVVDWFVDVQSALESIDRSNLLLLHTVLSVLQTEKRIYTLDDSIVDDLWITNCSIVAYERQHSRSLPTSPFRVDRGHLSSVNIVDGASLLFQAQ